MWRCWSAGEEYGDDAVAYVQIKRTGSQCEVQARITPEHKVNAKPYRVVAVIDEEKAEVAEVTIVSVDYDEVYCRGLLSRGEAFWRAAVYGELRRARAQ
ncbi:hypothetical protein FJT64_017005 [Amphibalanus amphitrite]|uniref:Uncharacterized protein n=1 Tax=Amphibalanus amphitrite TaxID=1232801 RepID=A0A6A4X876_AMPAM|nr:hypothetical protein FJT64_017005 [Amphibalanus amphitrite]